MLPPVKSELMDDLAFQVYEYMLAESVAFNGGNIVFLPITDLVKKFQKNHRTISRRLTALKDEGLVGILLKKTYGTLYWVSDESEES